MPYVAPEVLRGGSYTQAADIYSFGMIMYFIATGKQPFENLAHDQYLALNICHGIKPELSEPEAPKWYIDLMKKCLDLNPTNRPNVEELSTFFDILRQYEEAEKYRISHLLFENKQSIIHPKAIYKSRILNPFTKDLPKYDNINNDSAEIIDFTNLNIESNS
ncbi:kinase-like domain-containing protein [Glomus cerebriforme]|uniref:Kinase-like domain-containing protein n=1 Tax=Glomus cerebriforme TaxID=658196 RepID=A0A397TPC4_9GLOM|nr:kinase-like domain-containing protein [Glomus cerebriforme]